MTTSRDFEVQAVWEIVPPETGSIVVMDVENGEIICSVSSPHFNPNIFSRGLNVKEWNLIKNNRKSIWC